MCIRDRVGGIGVPLGILCGLLGIGVTLFFIGDYFSGILFGSDANSEITLHLVVSWQSILISFVIGMVTVLISAWIPAKRATRVSAVEAVRSSQDIKISCKEVKVNRLNYVCLLYTSGSDGIVGSPETIGKRGYGRAEFSLFRGHDETTGRF